MKNLFLFLLLIKVCSAQTTNGWYEADVHYTTPSGVKQMQSNYFGSLPVWTNGANSYYKLKVYLQGTGITKIAFPDGGSIHLGYNNEGYTYNGGILVATINDANEVVELTTSIRIIRQDGSIENYDISIK